MYIFSQCMRGMLDMLGESDGGRASHDRGDSAPLAEEDPDAILSGGGVTEAGSGAEAGVNSRVGGGKYAALLPHLLELVAYQSGVEAKEVSVPGCLFGWWLEPLT